MRVLNKIDRYNLVIDAINVVNNGEEELKQYCLNKLQEHFNLIRETGKDLEEVTNWKWQ